MKYNRLNRKWYFLKSLLLLFPILLLMTSVEASHLEFINTELYDRSAPYSKDGFNQFVADNCLSNTTEVKTTINKVFLEITDNVKIGKSGFFFKRSDELIASDTFAVCLASITYGKILNDTQKYFHFNILDDLFRIEKTISSYVNLSAIEDFSEKFEELRKDEPKNPNNVQVYLKYDSSKTFLGVLDQFGSKRFSVADIVEPSPVARKKLFKKYIEFSDDPDKIDQVERKYNADELFVTVEISVDTIGNVQGKPGFAFNSVKVYSTKYGILGDGFSKSNSLRTAHDDIGSYIIYKERHQLNNILTLRGIHNNFYAPIYYNNSSIRSAVSRSSFPSIIGTLTRYFDEQHNFGIAFSGRKCRRMELEKFDNHNLETYGCYVLVNKKIIRTNEMAIAHAKEDNEELQKFRKTVDDQEFLNIYNKIRNSRDIKDMLYHLNELKTISLRLLQDKQISSQVYVTSMVWVDTTIRILQGQKKSGKTSFSGKLLELK